MYTDNKLKKIQASTLYQRLISGDVELLGIAYNDEDYPTGVNPEVYIENLEFNQGEKFNFVNKLVAHDTDKKALEIYDNALSDSGLGFVKTEQMNQGIYNPGLMTDLMLRGTKYSQVKKVDIVNTFIEPLVEQTHITIAKDVHLTLYKITEEIELRDKYKHEVYLLTSEKKYDGQTLFGMLSKVDKLNKTDTEKVLDLLMYNNITCREIPGAYIESEKKGLSYNLYNTHDTGIFIVQSDDFSRYSIACGQSFFSFLRNNISNSKVENLKDNKFNLNIDLKTGERLSIFL